MKKNREFKRGFWREGEPFVWLCGISTIVLILMIIGLVGLIFAKGVTLFWPADVVKFDLKDGKSIMGQIMNKERIPDLSGGPRTEVKTRTLLKISNRDVYGLDFRWINGDEITRTSYPPDALVVEREEYGNMVGFAESFKSPDKEFFPREDGFFASLSDAVEHVKELEKEIETTRVTLEENRKPVTDIEIQIRKLQSGIDKDVGQKIDYLKKERERLIASLGEKISLPKKKHEELKKIAASYELSVSLATGEKKTVPLQDIIRFYRPNSMTIGEKAVHYIKKVGEFLFEWPRGSNTEGGIFPAIFGTVVMVLLMAIVTTPLGVLTALYLHEYAKPGPIMNMARLAVNNLAGVPSIVFGIFGLGFFIYFIGGGIDRMFFAEKLPTPTFGTGGILWASLTLALLTVPVVVVTTEEGLSAVPISSREGSLALGASKFQMIWNIVLPNAMPGILTGVILAIGRGAGEVAPLMITGVVKLVSALPVDAEFPFVHLDRKFMHLGFHIFDVGFQSPNVEAAKPMVYSTTLTLLAMVVILNIIAIILRNRLRQKYKGAVL